MYFKNEKHQELFTKAIKKMDQKDNVQMSVVMLYGKVVKDIISLRTLQPLNERRKRSKPCYP